MDIQEVLAIMSKVKGKVSGRIKETVEIIITLASTYSFWGEKFTFDINKDLDTEVNNLLLQMSNDLIDDILGLAKDAYTEENQDAVLAYLYRGVNGKDITERVDGYSSELKYLLEGYLAVCFANKLTKGDIVGDIMTFLANPYWYPSLRKAFENSKDYNAGIIRARGYHFGRGVSSSPVAGITLLGKNTINEAFQKDTILNYEKDASIIGYRVHRGSMYDCETCDELCIGIHPLTEQVLPSHPNCRCYTTPVYASEI